ncbi:response regulator [Rhodocaloribacter sp.]
MNADVINAIATLAWPVLAALLLFALLPTLIRVLRSRSVSIKFGDMELSVQDVSEQMRKQIEDLQNQVSALKSSLAPPSSGAPAAGAPAPGAPAPGAPAAGAAPASPATRTASPARKSILWVDDRPENNAFEIAKLQEDGYEIATATSTKAALAQLESGSVWPDLIISDMGRREGTLYRRTAGLDLIRAVRAKNIDVPIFIYASNEAVRKYSDQVREAGGNGITASPMELMEFIARHTS